MKSKISSSFLLILILVIANLFQVYVNVKCKKELYKIPSSVNETGKVNKENQKSFFIEEYLLQNFASPKDFFVFDIKGDEVDGSVMYSWNGLVLHINDVNCTDCNIKRLNHLLKVIEESGLNEILVIANFESHAEFKKMVIETGLDKYKVYNSTFKLKNLNTDTILLFYFEGNTIKYPFVVVDENMPILASYIEFIKLI